MFQPIVKKAVITAAVTVAIDFTFHYFLTNPMEMFTYFVVKFMLSFIIASAMFGSYEYITKPERRKYTIPISGLVFSTLMSTYYRAWELFEARAPWGSRAPDIFGLVRGTVLFVGAWWFAHASFFIVGVLAANKLIRDETH